MSNDTETPPADHGPEGADHHLHAEVVGDELVIRIGIATLAHACVNGCTGEVAGKVLDARGFAEDVCGAMLDEAEDGSCRLTKFIDAGIEAAIDDGSLNFATADELVSCETCEKSLHVDDSISTDDGYLCEGCHEDAVEEFARTRYRCWARPGCGWTGMGPETKRERSGELACPSCGGEVEEVGETPAEASEP